MPPPTQDQLRLLGIPNEILAEIISVCIEKGVHVKASNESGEFKLTLDPTWVPGIFLVCKHLRLVSEPVIGNAVKLEISERKRGAEMLAKP